MEQAMPRTGRHSGWSEKENQMLWETADEAQQQGLPLKAVFERVAEQTGRRPNSIRNYYYAQVRQREDADRHPARFVPFAPEEVEWLMEQVLIARAAGQSVRSCLQKLSGGDHSLMLRYQNKYRSTVRTRPELVRGVMERLNEQGRAYVSPYAGEESPVELTRLKTRAQESGDAHIGQLFESLDYLLARAMTRPEGNADAQRKADRLDDEHKRFERLQSEAGGMISLIKEYVALPEDARQTGLNAFCEQAAQSLSRVECAMMDAPQ